MQQRMYGDPLTPEEYDKGFKQRLWADDVAEGEEYSVRLLDHYSHVHARELHLTVFERKVVGFNHLLKLGGIYQDKSIAIALGITFDGHLVTSMETCEPQGYIAADPEEAEARDPSLDKGEPLLV
jgi:hypothetical protein